MTEAPDLIIREYDPISDISGVYQAFVSGFGHTLWPMIEGADPELTKDLIRGVVALGNHNLVADAGGEAD